MKSKQMGEKKRPTYLHSKGIAALEAITPVAKNKTLKTKTNPGKIKAAYKKKGAFLFHFFLAFKRKMKKAARKSLTRKT